MDAVKRISPAGSALLRELAAFRPTYRRALGELALTLALFGALWFAAFAALEVSYLLSLVFAAGAGIFLLRLFVIQHDCGHGSFTPSRRLNQLLGRALGILTCSPYDYWRQTHAIHHATSGNLDRRGHGDITTWTVAEYAAASRRQRLGYRVYRHPLVILGIGPGFLFLLKHRLPLDAPRRWTAAWRSVWLTNLALLGLTAAAAWAIGPQAFAMIHLPVVLVAATVGVFLFYVQHQFEGTYWARGDRWDFGDAALAGSSFLNLPRPLHWLTGNICFHHLHHLASKVPGYRLPAAYDALASARQVPHLGLRDALRSLQLRLWDETQGTLVDLRGAAELAQGDGAAAETSADLSCPEGQAPIAA